MPRVTLHPLASDPIEATLEQRAPASGERTLRLSIGEDTFEATHEELGLHQGLLRTATATVPYYWCRTASELHLWVAGDTYVFELHDLDDETAAHRSGGGTLGDLTAPMPGVIRKVLVSPGDTVEASAPLIVMESMKMQLSLPAPGNATVKEVLCREGQMVDLGAPLLRLAPPNPEASSP